MNHTTQLNITLPNGPGFMLKVCKALREALVNIEAIVCSEGNAQSSIHLIVNNNNAAKEALEPLGDVTETEVLSFEMQNQPGAVESIAQMCSASGCNIRNVYATTDGENAMVYVSVDDIDRFTSYYHSSVEC